MKKIFLFLPALFCLNSAFAEDGDKNTSKNDTLYTELKKEVVVMSSIKETNSLKTLPASVSVFTGHNLEALQVRSLKDLSTVVPNYFVADYGSKMTAPMYIRGIGARSGSQTVSMYVDNIPYFNTTSYDVELFDIQHLEVMRGTQGTLYGRNAMGGIINIYTLSPLRYKGVIARAGGGSHGAISTNASIYEPINDKMGISVGAFYNQHDGFFTNTFTGKKADDLKNIGARLKYVWNVSPRFTANYSVSVDYTEQGAFPYANAETHNVNYDTPGSYKRNVITNGLSLKYKGNGYEINSITGYQYLNDDMNMDTDYTSKALYKINQQQQQHSLSQEIAIKSNRQSNYQWSAGVYGFYDNLHLTPPVTFMKDGVAVIQRGIDMAHAAAPNYVPKITINDQELVFDGDYKRPSYAAAVFHQSTYNNLFIKGLSFTGGIRLDYEKTELDYYADAHAKTTYVMRPGGSPMDIPIDTVMKGKTSTDFLEILPKAVLKYEFDSKHFAYASVSRGYKAGGHNIQMFADLAESALSNKMLTRPGVVPTMPSIPDSITFSPEYSINYEIGGQCEIIDQMLSVNFALYYIDVKDVQVTQFLRTGYGRKITNAGKADSKGFEIGVKARPCNGFFVYANYGFADAKFTDYVTERKVDYTGKHIPFAPQSTFSVGGNITYEFKNKKLFDRVTLNPNYAGAGKIYWSEDNSKYQDFYGTLDLRLALEKSIFTFECWGKNILDQKYDAFLFESRTKGTYFSQQGKPAQWGASLKIKL